MRTVLCCAPMLLAGCGVRKGAPKWIPERAAFVQCTVAGRHLEVPPLLREVPHPEPATGLYSRGTDPIALYDLGFASERPVCAALLPERRSADEVTRAGESLAALAAARKLADKQAASLGRCVCEVARERGSRSLLSQCETTSTQRGCEVSEADKRALEKVLEPLEKAVAAAVMPRLHWRLVGITDRPGWFGEHLPTVLPRHAGGSDVYLKGAPVPPQLNSALLEHLLAREDVTAVVRQDSARALLVVREVGKVLIFDHFAYPNLGPEIQPLVGPLDNAAQEQFDRALEQPISARDLHFNPRKGTVLEYDEALLSLIDEALEAGTEVGKRPYRAADEVWTRPPGLLREISLLIPFGTQGRSLEFFGTYTEAGATLAAGLGDAPISVTAEEFGVSDLALEFEAGGDDPGMVFRGSTTQELLFDGLHRLPEVLAVIERNHPGTLGGSANALEVQLPSGPLPATLGAHPALAAMRERLSKQPYELKLTFDHNEVEGSLEPR